MMWGYGDGSGWGTWLGMALGMTLFWGLIIFGVIALARYLGGACGHHDSVAGRSDSEQILAERFARGEIDEDEYRKRREVLRGGR